MELHVCLWRPVHKHCGTFTLFSHQLSFCWVFTHDPLPAQSHSFTDFTALCDLFSTPPVTRLMLIHRVMKRRTMAPLGVQAHQQPSKQENIHKASLTAERQKESEGVGSGIIPSLQEVAVWCGWHENKLVLPQERRHGAGNINPQVKSAFLCGSGQSYDEPQARTSRHVIKVW